jgi:RNA polymerase sigma-70 factor (ECF subfamily)
VEKNEFQKIYDDNARKLYNFILWTTGNRSVCDDILQNVFVKVWRCHSVPPNGGECTAWLYAVTRNACVDYFRSTRKSVEFNEDIGGATEDSDAQDDGKLAWREVQRLPENERAIVFLHLKLGYSYAEIGRLMDMTENHVRVKAFRALRRLREILVRKGL